MNVFGNALNWAKCTVMLVLLAAACCGAWSTAVAEEAEAGGLRVATFDMDVTPPVGSHMAYDLVVGTWDMGLRARGIVLLGAGEPIVLCSLDWIGISNGAYDVFREALAKGAGTTPQRTAVHCIHQHDAPACDFSTTELLEEHGVDGLDELGRYGGDFARDVVARLEKTVRESLEKTQPVTHVGLGAAAVEKVASNRRILNEDGKVRAMRYTSCGDAKLRAEPEGTIDPEVSLISLWNGDAPVAVLSYYACHPQSYYRTGLPNPDFPGVARFLREMAVPQALHIHFNGAGGNLGAGKYNDGSKENRLILAKRLADGMRRAWESTERTPIGANDVRWGIAPAALPVNPQINVEALEAAMKEEAKAKDLQETASTLVWARRCEASDTIDITCLGLGRARILHLPGELFVEYQLAAKSMAPDHFVAMAAYGEYAPGYIGTTAGYAEGGYETSDRASHVAPEVEGVLMAAMRELLGP